MAKRLKILFLTARFPFPPVGGDKLKPYYILKHLAKKHDVTLVSLYQGANIPKNFSDEMQALGIKVHVVCFRPLYAGMRVFAKLLQKYPLEIAYYLQPELFSVINSLNPNANFDIAFSFFMRTAEYAKPLNIKKILMCEDCRTLYQQRSQSASHNLVQKLVRLWEFYKLKKYEPDIVNYFDASTFVTNNDIAAMRKLNPDANYRLLSNGVDIDKFIPMQEKTPNKTVIFMGRLDIWANQLMIKRIINNILPLIEQNMPDVHFQIVGALPPKKIFSDKRHNISIITDVPDTLPYLQNAQLFLHPHDGGTGIQNKLLEAMAAGCPVITTETGNQGIDAKNGVEALIGNTDSELAEHACNLILNQELAQKISANARELIVKTHSWDMIYKQVDDIINEVIN